METWMSTVSRRGMGNLFGQVWHMRRRRAVLTQVSFVRWFLEVLAIRACVRKQDWDRNLNGCSY